MSLNVFLDKNQEPDDTALRAALGDTWTFFDAIRALTSAYEQEWKHHGKKYGWKLKVHAHDKNLLELTVAEGWFLVTMAIREQERVVLEASSVAAATSSTPIDGSAVAGSYGIKVEVRDSESCERVKGLVELVMEQRDAG